MKDSGRILLIRAWLLDGGLVFGFYDVLEYRNFGFVVLGGGEWSGGFGKGVDRAN